MGECVRAHVVYGCVSCLFGTGPESVDVGSIPTGVVYFVLLVYFCSFPYPRTRRYMAFECMRHLPKQCCIPGGVQVDARSELLRG